MTSAKFEKASKVILILISTCFYLNLVSAQTKELVINEFLASNSTVNYDPDFNAYSDWFEIYNPQNYSVDISGYYLTDNSNIPAKWKVPAGVSIAPKDFLLFWADGRDTVLSAFHTNFKLSKSGEEIALFNPDSVLVDKFEYRDQTADISYGRQPDGSDNWFFFDIPTPGTKNNSPIHDKTPAPVFSLPAGFYSSEQTLEISADGPQVSIRYTINGDEPSASSLEYQSPISLQSRIGEANYFSMIRTNRDPFLWLPDWIPPANGVFKANIIRARAFKAGSQSSDIISATYFIDENSDERYSTLPVISIMSDYDHLFDNFTGIYVPGSYHINGESGTGNYFEDWERPAHIEFFDTDRSLGFSQDAGISIQGGTSPASPQKGLHVIARSIYGRNRIEYPIFKECPSKARHLTEFKRFIIRAWGSLITGALFNDAYAHRLMAENDLDIQEYRPAVVFINGEYWGLHALREANKNSWYYQNYYDIDRENPGYDILQHSIGNGQPYAYIDEGDDVHWQAMIDFLNTHDMTISENYEYIKTQLDMDNFIAYLGHCIYVSKWDWPNNNDASWRPRTADGRWRWIQYDMETGFGVAASLGPQYEILGPQLNMVKAVIEGINIPGFGRYGPHPIAANLYKNKEFQNSFVDWFIYHMKHEFHPDSMNYLLDEMAAEIRPYMQEYKNRWPFIGGVNTDWAASIERMKEFNRLRPDYMKQHLLQYFNTDKLPPVNFKLMQNFPNPFNSKTTIKYGVPKAAKVSISIYNILGQKIASFTKNHDSTGYYLIQWDAKTFAAGVYLYLIQSGKLKEVKKMVLVK